MHEISLCESILEVLESEAIKQGFSKVKSVWIEIGDLSCVEPEAMLFAFDAITRNSLADGAKLKIINIPASAWCERCAKNVVVQYRFDECPDCSSPLLEADSGDEMRIKELEVE